MSMIIPLTKGRHAIVDESDYDWLSQFKWRAVEGKMGSFYAQTRYPIGRTADGKIIYRTREMQRIILDLENNMPSRKMIADHKNHDTQDNCRFNLRWVTNLQNRLNSRDRRNKSGYRGVFYDKINKCWSVKLVVNGVRYRKVCFKTPEAAALAYNELAIKYHREFAILNVIKERPDDRETAA
jgi:hypothetical protein